MAGFLQSLFWLIMGVVADRVYDSIIYPTIIRFEMQQEIKKKRKLYYGSRTFEILKEYYEGQLFNCKIQNVSRQIPFLTHSEWEKQNIDVIANPEILQFVDTTNCSYPIRRQMINKRKKIGQRLEDNPSLFLHRVLVNNNEISFEAGEYQYFRRISFINDFEVETYNMVYSIKKKKWKLRSLHIPKLQNANITTDNTIPLGCDAVVAIKIEGKYHICINERSHYTVNYPGAFMTVPSFGFGSVKNVENPLLFSFFKEYSEELFDREEMASPDNYINPEWFFDQFEEIKTAMSLARTGEFRISLIGCGFDVIGGFFNLSLLAIIDNADVSHDIYSKCKGNWETNAHQIKFVPIDSPVLGQYLLNNQFSPSSAYTISRAISILSVASGDTHQK